jgi:predicted dehydrogenase
MLYLKRVEGEASTGRPIRPAAVTARVHELTKIRNYRDAGFLRSNYEDVEDYAWAHVVFEDGTVGDVVTGATVLGGINDYVDVFANNHRTRCNINPVGLMETYNPRASQFSDIYVNYGITTNEGWLYPAPDENWMFGYQAEMQDALECVAFDREPIAGLQLAMDTVNVIYSAYLSAEHSGQEISVERL